MDRTLVDQIEEADACGHSAYTRFLCERALKTDPDHGRTLIRYARSLIELSQYEAAEEALAHAMKVVPEKRRYLVFAQQGHLLEQMGDLLGAEALHMKAHELDPNDATYLIYASSVAFRRGDVGRAEELARQAIACKEGCVDEAYFNLGSYLLAQKRFEHARECYRKAIEIDPDYELALLRLADVERVLAGEDGNGAA